jgi:hypothetical protein
MKEDKNKYTFSTYERDIGIVGSVAHRTRLETDKELENVPQDAPHPWSNESMTACGNFI